MPLARSQEQFEFEQFEGVYFWMKDEAKYVVCKVSHRALRDRSARDGENATLPDTFVRHRQRIEMIAGEKYDRGHPANGLILILTSDLTPAPDVTRRMADPPMVKSDHQSNDYSVVVKNRAPLPNAWRWEIYRAGNYRNIKQSSIYFGTVVAAKQAGIVALGQLLDKLNARSNAKSEEVVSGGVLAPRIKS